MLKSAGRFFYYTYMKSNFTKPYSSPKQIVQILKTRGMLMEDEQKVENYLMNIGYHRLSAYIYPFYKSPKDDMVLKDGTTFKQALTLYRFDKKLRILLFNEIEKIEVAIRSILANIGCQELGDKYWITRPEYFANADKFNQTLAVIEKELASCKEDYIEDFMLTPSEPHKVSSTWIDTSKIDKKRIFYRLCIIRYILASVSPNNNFNEKIANLLDRFPSIDIAAMGFYEGWENEHLWL